MLDILTLIVSILLENRKLTLGISVLIIYLLYYKKYGFYIFKQKYQYIQGKHRIGKSLPAHPNGWFVLMRSSELKPGETKFVDTHGESIALFRGNNGKPYALECLLSTLRR